MQVNGVLVEVCWWGCGGGWCIGGDVLVEVGVWRWACSGGEIAVNEHLPPYQTVSTEAPPPCGVLIAEDNGQAKTTHFHSIVWHLATTVIQLIQPSLVLRVMYFIGLASVKQVLSLSII